MPAPGIIFRSIHHARAHRVQVNVSDDFKQVGIGIQQQRLVAPLEDVPGTSLGKVYPFCISQGKILHDSGKWYVAYLHDEMGVVCHETKTMYAVSEPLHCLLKDLEEPKTVAVIEKDRSTGVATKDNVVHCAGKIDAWFTWHAKRISLNG